MIFILVVLRMWQPQRPASDAVATCCSLFVGRKCLLREEASWERWPLTAIAVATGGGLWWLRRSTFMSSGKTKRNYTGV